MIYSLTRSEKAPSPAAAGGGVGGEGREADIAIIQSELVPERSRGAKRHLHRLDGWARAGFGPAGHGRAPGTALTGSRRANVAANRSRVGAGDPQEWNSVLPTGGVSRHGGYGSSSRSMGRMARGGPRISLTNQA